VSCNDDDGELSLTFVSQDTFDYAKNAWGWVNDRDEREFLLIANSEGCGKDAERSPYMFVCVHN
jgi:hypothetical protein